MSKNGFLRSSLLRPQLLIILTMISVAVFALQSQETRVVHAAVTGTLSANGQGNYTAWDGDEDDIDDGTVDCEDGDDGDDNVASNTTNQRESVDIDLSSIPNGSTVQSAEIHVWDIDDLDSANSAPNGTYRTFVRVGTTDTDAGADLTASATCSEKTQTINFADFMKISSTDFEIGVLKTAGDTDGVWVGAIRVIVTYALPSTPALVITAADFFDQPSVIVLPGVNVPVDMTGNYNYDGQGDDWGSTRVVIDGPGAPVDLGCVNHDNRSYSGPDTVEDTDNGVVITAPNTPGVYDVILTGYPSSDTPCVPDAGDPPASLPFTVLGAITVVEPAANPEFPASCAMDIILVLDKSGSIDSTEQDAMEDAMEAFVDAFLPATDSRFAVVNFDWQGTVSQAFTNNVANLDTAIAADLTDGNTNWEDPLDDAIGLLPGRPDVDFKNLVIFASDGNPNAIGDPGFSVAEAVAVGTAVARANTIKATGTRIITLGIGEAADSANLIAISSAGAYIESDFDELAEDLADLAAGNCEVDICIDGEIQTVPAGTPSTNDCGLVWVCDDGDEIQVTLFVANEDNLKIGGCETPPPGNFPNPGGTVVPVQQVAAVQATPGPVVAAIQPPATGSGGLQSGGSGSLYALVAGLLGLGAFAALAVRRGSHQA